MATLPDSARTLIESGRLARLVTVGADGSPQVTLVWVGLDGDEIVSAHLGEHQKVRNVRHDPRVVLSIEGSGRSPEGLDEYLVVYGTARITEGRAGAAPGPGRALHRPRGEVPADGQPSSGVHHQDRRGPGGRRRPMDRLTAIG